MKNTIAKTTIAALVVAALSGCGLIAREFEIPGVLRITFPEGFKVSAGANSIDRVDDRAGVSPYTLQKQGKFTAPPAQGAIER